MKLGALITLYEIGQINQETIIEIVDSRIPNRNEQTYFWRLLIDYNIGVLIDDTEYYTYNIIP